MFKKCPSGHLWPVWRRERHPHQTALCRVPGPVCLQRISYGRSSSRSRLSNLLGSVCLRKKYQDTTRAPRPGETDGKEYHFVTQDTFKSLLNEGAFIEHAQFSSNYYGTSIQAIEAVQATGKRCILDIESQVGSRLRLCTSSDVLIKARRALGKLRKLKSILSTCLSRRPR